MPATGVRIPLGVVLRVGGSLQQSVLSIVHRFTTIGIYGQFAFGTGFAVLFQIV